MSVHVEETVTRQELFEQIWATPLTRLAREYGLSDVGLAKICKRMEIPRPPRGYWRRIETGQTPTRPKLRPLSKTGLPQVFLNRPGHLHRPASDLGKAENIPVSDSLERPHRLVRVSRAALNRGRRNERGVVEPIGGPCLDIRVSGGAIKRACLVMDALVKALEHRGASVVVDGNGRGTVATVEGEPFRFCLEEHIRRTNHVATPAEQRRMKRDWAWPPRFDYTPTGRLSLNVYGMPHGRRESWRDGKVQRVEDCLGSLVRELRAAAEQTKAGRAEEQRRRQAREELARAERERLRLERLEQLRRDKLSTDAAAWVEARRLRAYITELGRVEGDVPGLRSWLDWASRYVATLDPLCSLETLVPKLGEEEPFYS